MPKTIFSVASNANYVEQAETTFTYADTLNVDWVERLIGPHNTQP
jgi:hypothetical protein